MTDPYLLLPPMHPEASASPEPTPPAADEFDADDLDDVVDDPSPSLALPERGETGEPSEGDDTEPVSPEDGEDFDDRDWLIERANKADEYERYLESIRANAAEQKVTREWDDALATKNAEFSQREDAIFAQANESLNPVAYLREEMRKLNAEANGWYERYQQGRDQALSRFQLAREIPQFAARVVEHFKLPEDAINEILEYAPEQMEREAQKMRARLIKERKQAKQIDQLKRKAANRAVGANPLSTGGGRGSAGNGDIALGSDQHYHAIPWGRGR